MSIDDRAPRSDEWADLENPSAARMYDWYLGGDASWAIDREFGKDMLRTFPMLSALMRCNRRWMGRVVQAALDAGITQFLDLGAGIPTKGNSNPEISNVHDLVAATLGTHSPRRVVYVDNESVAGAHTEYIIADDAVSSWVSLTQADLRDPATVMKAPTTRTLDLTQPVCVLMVSVLQFLGPGDGPVDIVAGYRSHLAPGSWIAISHPAVDDAYPQLASQVSAVAEAYERTQNPIWLRDRNEIAKWFDGTELLDPGLVHLPDWRPKSQQSRQIGSEEAKVGDGFWCGVGSVYR